MGGKAKKAVKPLAAAALGPVAGPLALLGFDAFGRAKEPDLPEPPEERELEAEIEPTAATATKLLQDRRAKRRRQTPTILTSPLGANPSPTVSRTTLGGV